MSSTYLDLAFRVSGREVFTAAEAPAAASESERTLRCGQHNLSRTYGPTTVPAITGPPVSRTITLGSGITTIDLTNAAVLALPGNATRTFDFVAKRVVGFILRTATTNNSAGVNIAPGAANPYPLFGAGNDITLLPGSRLQFGFDGIASGLPAVSGTAKSIDLTGTSGDVVYVDLYLGS
jgi:hypothetical protein